MEFWGVYLLVVGPLLLVATAAVWVPRPWQVVLLYAGPALEVLGWAGVPGVERLGYLPLFGTPYILMLVLPVLPWRRQWACWAVPLTVLLVSALVIALAKGEAPALFFVAYPVVLSLGALVVATVSWRRRRGVEAAAGGVPEGPDGTGGGPAQRSGEGVVGSTPKP